MLSFTVHSLDNMPQTPDQTPKPVEPTKNLWRSLLLVSLVLLVPIIPFLLLGHFIEDYFSAWKEQPPAAWVTSLVVFGLLASDILLPVPSSLVSTLAGSQLGFVQATAVSFSGLTVGAILGFWIARKFGPAVAHKFATEEDLESMQRMSDKYGAIILVLTRALPILAEATVLLMGINQLSWKKFLPPVILANLGIALGYSLFGEIAAQQEWLLIASAISVALPFGLAMFIRNWLKRKTISEY